MGCCLQQLHPNRKFLSSSVLMIVKISKNYLILLLITSCGIISLFMLHLFQSYQLRLSILRDRQPGAQHRAIPLIKSFTTAITSSTHTRCHNSTLFSVPIGNYTQRAALLTCSIDDAIRLSKIAQDLSGRMVPYKHDSMIIQDGVPNTGILFLYDRRDIDPCYVHYISLKYNPSCGHDKSLRPRFIKPLLIVAVQRSGKMHAFLLVAYNVC